MYKRQKWARAVIWWGARAHLTMGLAGHPDAIPAMQKFRQLTAEAMDRFPANAWNVNDRNTEPVEQPAPPQQRG